jgi:hypothetical protein
MEYKPTKGWLGSRVTDSSFRRRKHSAKVLEDE